VIEREAKLGAPASFALPDIGEVADTQQLDATYYDGPSTPLAKIGATVRFRTGEGPDRWTVKLPASGGGAGSLARDEIDVDAPPSVVPAPVHDAVATHLGGEVLVPVARLVTERRRVHVREGNEEVAEVADDLVRVLDGDREVASFREVEVELAPGAPDAALAPIVEQLQAAGAGEADPTPKLVRALRLMGSAI